MIVHMRVESAHLAGNLLGDPSERDLFVYLPPGYRRAALVAADRGCLRARLPARRRF